MLNTVHRANAQATSAQRFADETPGQRARHHEIARRYRRGKRRDRKFPNLRKRELERVFRDRYGGDTLPDDDAGRDDLRLMADHLAQLSADHIRRWARAWAPWADDDALTAHVGDGRRWTATALAKALNLDDETRTRLRIKTIGAVDRSKRQRAERRRERKATKEAERRAKAGAKPHALSEARTKPWEALGISESTYRRRKRRQTESGDSNSWRIHLDSQRGTNRCHHSGPPPLKGGSQARAEVVACTTAKLSDVDGAIAPEAVHPDRVFPVAARESKKPTEIHFGRQSLSTRKSHDLGNGAAPAKRARPSSPPPHSTMSARKETAMKPKPFDDANHFSKYFAMLQKLFGRTDDAPAARIVLWRAVQQSDNPALARPLIADAVMARRFEPADNGMTLAEFIRAGSWRVENLPFNRAA